MAVDRDLFRLALCLLLSINLIDARECKIGCLGKANPLYNLESGKAYSYAFEGKAETTLAGATNVVSTMGIKAQVVVTAGATCENYITVKDVQVTSDSSSKVDLKDTVVKFGMQGGKIEDLCVDKEERTYSLNIKRAILSLLQTSVLKDSGSSSATEIDIHGSCPTRFDFTKTGNSLSVRKVKDLNRCAFRENYVGALSPSSYLADSDIQSSHLMSGSLTTVQTIEGGVLKEAKSEETYSHNGPNALEAPAKTVIKSSLVLSKSAAGAAPAAPGNLGKSLIFDAGHGSVTTTTEQELTKDIEHLSKHDDITEACASSFNNLVRKLRKADATQIGKVDAFCGADKKKKSVFMDALFGCGSSDCVYYIAELMTKGDIKDERAKMWFARIGFATHAHPDALKKISGLIKEDSPTSAFLGVGMLAGKYCKQHACKLDPSMEDVEKSIATPLLKKGCKVADKKSEDKVIASLKGLTNINYLTKTVADAVIECATNKAHSNRLRAAALDTLRSDAHNPTIKEAAAKVFNTDLEDSELRIKAYLVLAECPCGKVATWVKDVLESEKSFQVGAFIVSHLRNVRASTDPQKSSLKKHLGAIMTSKRYPFDFRKFSQNYEVSYKCDLLNMGTIAESNVIYSQHSFVPRTLSLNLTSQLFGQSFNWLQVDARLENVEKALEKIFGPEKDQTNEHRIYRMKEKADKILEKIASKLDKPLRPKREASVKDLKALATQAKLQDNGNNVDIDLNLKTGGSQFAWMKYHSDDKQWETDNIIDSAFEKIEKVVDGAKSINMNYKRYMSLVDLELQYGTGLGLPIVRSLHGAVAVTLKVDGKLDIPAILRDPKNTDIKFQLIPSAAIDLVGSVIIDGIKLQSGIQLHSVAHTSTGSDISFRILDGTGIDVKLGLPVDKQEVLNFKTSFQKVKNNFDVSDDLVFNVKREKYEGCFDQLGPYVGLIFCGKADAPWEGTRTLNPAYGPINLKLSVNKEDPSLSTYHFRTTYTKEKNADNSRKFEILLDTPGTKMDRKLSLNVEGAIQNKKYLKANLKSPWTQATFDSYITTSPAENIVYAKLKHDDSEYLIKGGFKKTKSGNAVKYEPVLEYKAPEFKSTLIGRRGGAKQAPQTYTLTGAIIIEPQDRENKITVQALTLHSPRTKFTLDGIGSYDSDPFMHLRGDYKLSWDKENVQVKFDYDKPAHGPNIKLWLSVLPSQYRDFGVDIKYELKKKDLFPRPQDDRTYELRFSLTHGPDPSNTMSRISLSSFTVYNLEKKTINTENKASYPVLNLEGTQFLKKDAKSFNAGLKGKLDRYSGELRASGDLGKKDGEYNLDTMAEVMGNTVNVKASRNVIGDGQAKYQNSLELKPGGKYELNMNVNHKKGKESKLQVNTEVVLPAEPKLIKIDLDYQNKEKSCSTSLKAVAGAKELINAEMKVTQGESLKANLKLLDLIDGQVDSLNKDNKIKSKMTVSFPRIDKKMEGTSEIVEGLKSGNVAFCWDTKDPKKSIIVEYNNDITWKPVRNIISRSSLNYQGSVTKLVLTYKGEIGDDVPLVREIELLLPDGDKLSLGGQGTVKKNGGELILKFNVAGSCTHPDGKSSVFDLLEKISVSGDMTLNGETHKYKGLVGLNLLNKKKEDFDSSLKFDVQDISDVWHIKTEAAAKGKLMENKDLLLKLDAEPSRKEPKLKYTWSAELGKDTKLGGNGLIKLDKKESSIDAEVNGKLPETSEIKTFKWTLHHTFSASGNPAENKAFKLVLNNDLSWNDKFVKHGVELAMPNNQGVTLATELKTPTTNRKLTGSANWADGDPQKADVSGTYTYDGKTADLGLKLEKSKDNSAAGIHVIVNSAATGKVHFVFKHKTIKEKNGIQNDLTLSINDKKMAANSIIELVPDHPLVDINIDYPDGKSKIYLKNDRLGDRHWAGENKLKWTFNKGGSFNSDYEADFQSLESFSLKANVDSPQMDLNKMQVEFSNKHAKDNKNQIAFNIKRDGKTVSSGNLDYEIKKDGDNYIIEGKGVQKDGDKTIPITFEYKSHTTDGKRDAKWTLDYGKMRYSSKYETNQKHFYMDFEHCLEKDCAKSMYENKLEQTSNNRLAHEVKVVLDLRPISTAVKHPISFHSKLSLDIALPLEQQVELKWSKNGKLKYHAEIKEKGLSILLHTPKRIVGIESKIESPKDSKKIETSVWFDKGKGDRLTVVSSTSFVKGKDSATFSGETKVSHKSLGKDFVVKGSVTSSTSTKGKLDGELILDIFEKSDDKVVITVKNGASLKEDGYEQSTQASLRIDSCKLKIGIERQLLVNWKDPQIVWTELAGYTDSKGGKREIGAKFELNRKVITGHVKIPGSKVLEINGKINDSPKTISIEGTTTILKKQYKNNLVINTADSNLKYTLNFDGKTIDCEASAVMGQKGLVKVSFDNKDCASLEVALDEPNFLKSTYNYNIDSIKAIFYALADSLSGVQKDATTLAKQIAETEKKEAEILVSCLQKKVRTLTPMLKHVEGELTEIGNEILQDEYVKAASEALKHNYGKVIDGAKEIWKELVEFASTLQGILEDTIRKLTKIWKEISPKLSESIERISNIVLSLVEETVKISKKIADKVLDELKKHEKDIKEYLKVVTDFIHEIGKQIGKVVFVVHDEIKKMVEVTLEQMKDFPLINAVKEKYNELKQLQVPEEFWGFFIEIQEDLKNIMPTKESAELVEMTANYLEKIIKQEKFDLQEAGVKLLQQLSKAISSIVNRVSEYVPIQDKLKSKNYLSKLSFSNLLRIPKGGIRVSLLSLLISKDLPTIYELLQTYHLSLKPWENVPPFKGLGLILDGTEIITFDGRHISFKGSCDYILASDYLHNNFTVVAHVKNGVMDGLTVSDGPDSITFKAEGESIQRGNKKEFPMESRFMTAWVRPHSVGAYDKFGLLVICSRDLTYCEVTVNGFYFDRTRGLLGNMNYERYDDLLLPNGQIAADDMALANGWKVGTCADIPSSPHSHTRNPLCTELLTKNYELAIGTPWAPISPFRAACDHLTNAAPEPKKKETACKVVQAYVRMAQLHGAFFLRLPTTCTVCPINGANLHAGEIKEVPINLGKADITFVVEGTSDNEENFNKIFKPLVKGITDNLATQNCKDVRVSVVSFNTRDSWPHYHTSKGKLHGDDFKIQFVPRPEISNATRADRIKNLSRNIIKDLGLSGRSVVYADVLEQENFRPDARKIVIGMHSTPCIPKSLITLVGPVIESVVANVKGIVYHVITPLKEKTPVPIADILGITDGKILKKSGEFVNDDSLLSDDICVEAATLTGGYAFNAPQPEDLNKVAKEIADDDDFVNVKMSCTCGLYRGIIPSATCYRSDTIDL